MGYTHYFNFKEKQNMFDEEVLKKLKKVTYCFFNKGIIQAENDNPEKPVVTPREIVFNGIGEEGHETFYLTPDTIESNFCKTAHKDYDFPTCVILLILKVHYQDIFELRSDGFYGELDENWRKAITYVNKLYGETVVSIKDIKDNKVIRIY
ncbi:hypothetical protein [Brassicibacter mesophilus]|uniref:hypothetical protein n=1 Tax=Brassicibacter mesophilus TaxID=745119 RepID=UPI003D256923